MFSASRQPWCAVHLFLATMEGARDCLGRSSSFNTLKGIGMRATDRDRTLLLRSLSYTIGDDPKDEKHAVLNPMCAPYSVSETEDTGGTARNNRRPTACRQRGRERAITALHRIMPHPENPSVAMPRPHPSVVEISSDEEMWEERGCGAPCLSQAKQGRRSASWSSRRVRRVSLDSGTRACGEAGGVPTCSRGRSMEFGPAPKVSGSRAPRKGTSGV